MTFNYATYRGYIRKYNLRVYPRNTFNRETADIVIEHGGRSRPCGADLYFVTRNRSTLNTDEMALIVSSGTVPCGYRQSHGTHSDRYEVYYKPTNETNETEESGDN